MSSDLSIITQESAQSASTEQLKSWFAESLAVTAENLKRLAVIWKELESRGEDLSHLKSGLMSYLGLIAENKILPELVVRCAGQAMLLKKMSQIPIEEQYELAQKGAGIFEISGGEIIKKVLPLEMIPSTKLSQLFGPTEIRTDAEQIAIIQSSLKRPRSPNGTKKPMEVTISLPFEQYQSLLGKARSKGQYVTGYLKDLIEKDLEA